MMLILTLILTAILLTLKIIMIFPLNLCLRNLSGKVTKYEDTDVQSMSGADLLKSSSHYLPGPCCTPEKVAELLWLLRKLANIFLRRSGVQTLRSFYNVGHSEAFEYLCSFISSPVLLFWGEELAQNSTILPHYSKIPPHSL
jgi:hypothetical protein